jgi:hypothetical protein
MSLPGLRAGVLARTAVTLRPMLVPRPAVAPGTSLARQPQSPSVTSVTSVRCFPLSRVPAREHIRAPIPDPLCGLGDLRPMLSLFRVFSHARQQCSPERIGPPTSNPLCGLRGLCAMLSPFASSRTRANGVHPSAFGPPTSNPPLWPP